MNHQDWNPVILRKPVPKTPTKTFTAPKPKPIEGPMEKVSQKLKTAFIQARITAGKTQAALAKEVRGLKDPIAMIRDLESGKLGHKEAVQVALKAEKALRTKIL